MTTREETASVRAADAADKASVLPNAPEPANPPPGDRPRQEFSTTEKRVTLAALMIVFMLSALDSSIVSTAMPKIVSQLSGLELYAWVTTAYMLSSTVMVPIYGKLSDIYGQQAHPGDRRCDLHHRLDALRNGRRVRQPADCRRRHDPADLLPRDPGLGGRSALHLGVLDHRGPVPAAGTRPARRSVRLGVRRGHGVRARWLAASSPTWARPTSWGWSSPAGAGCSTSTCPWRAWPSSWCFVKMPTLTHKRPGKIDFIGAFLIVAASTPLLLALSEGRTHLWVELAADPGPLRRGGGGPGACSSSPSPRRPTRSCP